MSTRAENLLIGMYEAFYEYESNAQQESAIAKTGEYLSERVNSDGIFPGEEDYRETS